MIDADLDPLHFDLLVGPGGMAIDPEAGVVVWTPAADQGRVHDVILRMQDRSWRSRSPVVPNYGGRIGSGPGACRRRRRGSWPS